MEGTYYMANPCHFAHDMVETSPSRLSDTGSHERMVFVTANVAVGATQCGISEPEFRDGGRVSSHRVGFPRTAVWIRQSGSPRLVADPQVVTIFNAGREYQRHPICPDGDRRDWFAVAPQHAVAIAEAHDPAATSRHKRTFRFELARVDPVLFMRQRRLFTQLQRGELDVFEGEEAVLSLVGAVIERAAGAQQELTGGTKLATAARRDLVEAARAELARTVSYATDITDLARRLETSPYHLCRVFRKSTGLSLPAYQLNLRLRLATEQLEDPKADVPQIATELGFTSAVHLATLLESRYRTTPSNLRCPGSSR